MRKHLPEKSLAFLLSLILFFPGYAPDPAAGQEEKSTGKMEGAFPDMEADFIITFFDSRGHAGKTKARIIRRGEKVRFQGDTKVTNMNWIIDYEKMEETRIFEKDKIYFVKPVGERFKDKARLEGLFPFTPPKNFSMNRIPIRKETIDGHPCEFVVITQVNDKFKESGQSTIFVWEALDLDRQPLKIAFYERNLSLKILEFKNIKTGSVDETLLVPPEDYLSLTPY